MVLVPRRVEEVVVIVPESVYDRAVAAVAESGLLHVDRPPRDLPAAQDRRLSQAFTAASEKAARLEGFFRLAGLEPRLARGVEVRVSGWLSALEEITREYRDLDEEFERAAAEIGDLEARLQELKAVKALLEELRFVDANLRRAATQLRHSAFAVGFMPADALARLEALAGEAGVVAAYDPVREGREALVAVAGPHAAVHEAVSRLRGLGWAPLRLPEEVPGNPARAYEEVGRAIAGIESRLESIREALRGLADRLSEYYTKVYVLREALRILANTARTKTLAVFRGYVDVRDRRRLEKILSQATDGRYMMVSLGVKKAEERIPSKVDVPRFLRPFQRVLELYGHPDPGEIVPTLFMAVTVPVIFALMFPDAGHGILVTLFAYYYLIKKRGSRDWGTLVMILGLSGVVSGVMAAEFFGPITGKPLLKMWEALGFETPPLSSPLHAAMEGESELVTELVYRSIGISLWVGGFMLFFGSLLGLVDALLKRDWEEALAVKAPKFLFFASATLPFIVTLDPTVSGAAVKEAVFGPRESLLSNIVFYGALAGLLWLFLGEPLAGLATGHGARLGTAFMEVFETILMVMGNIPSFLRIMGLSLAHSGLMMGFAIMSEPLLEGGLALAAAGVVVYALGNLLTASLEGIISFAHNLRLHFYEWFSKFYSGTGMPFRPVRIPEGARIVLAAPGLAGA